MRRIIAFDRVSADGYFAGPDGNLDWVVPDEELDKSAAAASSSSRGQGTLMFGRRTYEMFESYWPRVVDDSGTAPDPHMPNRRSPEMYALAVFINDAEKIVFSRTLKNPTWKNTRVIPQIDPREIEAIKKESGTDIMIFGSSSVVSQLAEHDLIDEYQFIVVPVLLGSGKHLVSGVSKRSRLHLEEAKPYKTGNLMLRYASHE